MNRRVIVVVASFCVAAAGCSHDKSECSRLEGADERLACYDGAGHAPQTQDAVAVPDSVTTAPIPPSDEQQVQVAVRKLLIDPTAPIFGQFTKYGEIACITINSKNQFGGYTGDKQLVFVQIPGEGWLPLDVIDEVEKSPHHECVRFIRLVADAKSAAELDKAK